MSRPGETYEPLLSSWALSSIVRELCERAGVPFDAIDASLLEGMVDGFYINGGSSTATAAIEALAGVYQFDSSNYDGMLHFIPRGGTSIADIEDDDLIDDGNAVETRTRNDPINIPRVMHLRYMDTDGGLTPNKQTSDRSSDYRATSEVGKETTVIMRADDAARAITIQHKVEIEEQRGDREFSLPLSWIWLTVADVIGFRGERMRISSVDIQDGFQKYRASFDRLSAFESTIQGLPIPEPSVPPDLEAAETVLHVIDCHILQDSHDNLGYYIAVAGKSTEWNGAVVQLSRDGGESWTAGGSIRTSAIMGELVTPLNVGPVPYPDRINTFEVELLRQDMELVPATLPEMMNRSNLCIVGDELINFSSVEQITETRWRLSYLLRGRKGTAAVQHDIGERFVIMHPAMVTFVRAERFFLERELTFRATSIGMESSDETQTLTYIGRSQVERAPSYFIARRFTEGLTEKINFSWQGIGKLGGGSSIGMGQFFRMFRLDGPGLGNFGIDIVGSVTGSIDVDYAPGTYTVRQLNGVTGPGSSAELEVL